MSPQPEILVLLCGDTGSRSRGGLPPAAAHDLVAAVRRGIAGMTSAQLVLGSRRTCAQPGTLAAMMKTTGTRLAVLGCRHLSQTREQILASLREAGVSRAGVRLVDLLPEAKADPARVAWQSAARMVAAIAGVAHADLEVPDRERAVIGPMSRHSLLHPARIEHRPVASWIAGRCDGGAGCAACVLACPRGALRLTPAGPVVDEAACTGCGGCASACRAGAMALAGWPVGQLKAEARSLVVQAQRADRGLVAGVAMTCAQAVPGHRAGSDWLPLEVPSLEMVTADWVLMLASTGVTVAITACDDEPCSRRALELDALCGALAGGSARIPAQSLSLRSTGAADAAPRRCASCGQPLAAGLTDVAERLAASYPLIADRLAREERCADCLLLPGLGAG